jgi:flagella basal body P-ring formation protein FlgA
LIRFGIVLFISCLGVFAARASKFEVRVAEKSTVRAGDPIRLVALLKGEIPDSELNAKLSDLVVFEALANGTEKTFKSQELVLILRERLSFQDLQRLSVKVPERFVVRAQRNFLYPTDIAREIKERAQAMCAPCTVEFEDLNMPEMKGANEVLQTHLDTQALKGAGSFLLPLQVETSQGRNVHWVTGKISFYKMAPVAKRLIRANERIAESDFEIKKINISYAKDGIPSKEDLSGKLSMRTLAVGQPIFAADLKKEPAATRGQSVRILTGNESFEIVTSGIAEEGGSIGDSIKVKSSDTQKLLSGVLIDKGTVRVQ